MHPTQQAAAMRARAPFFNIPDHPWNAWRIQLLQPGRIGEKPKRHGLHGLSRIKSLHPSFFMNNPGK
jgi:hypothetical protein